ncbi:MULTISPECIES: adenosylcobinamide-GDP ribazoletransferase [unclassified Sphingomonas]|uniref:adenosylcobinamide-GDP ribazoletransferase n=1 Tax=unclassified Sphingomonas TaxID=196159 RepID=UPI0006FD3F00|nr:MULTISPECIES: adenosylcobinamide-GDP ribazoletransferase [unclassified Sphingomonas]KQX19401.1 cobalamin synthase [Sphingomonas sp. Root1294]KQY65603.1 cobalamin synthase [Sphingomonas sp. Root50]KRB95095.1 cobalamin synthase [Sphingomonas sp. Root720]
MKGLVVAIQFLTRLPGPRIAVSDADFARSMRWFPAVGLIVGAIVAGGARAGALVDPWVGALAGLLLWVGVTGALHLDGLGDVADAAGAVHKGPERLLAVLADPHVGSFGAVAIGLQLIAKLILLRVAIDADLWLAIVAAPFAARIGTLLWTRLLPSLHPGLAARFRDGIGWPHILSWFALLFVAAWFVPALLAAPLFMLSWGGWLRRTIGGISGDGHGAGIELVESALLFAAIIVARIA